MPDVDITYKGETIAELDEPGSKTLKTSATYCEGDITVAYAPRSRSYEITLAHVGGWVLLTTLDEDVLAHIHDPDLVVSWVRIGKYEYTQYTCSIAIVTNNIMGYVNTQYALYGVGQKEIAHDNHPIQGVFYPANNAESSVPLGGTAFRLDGDKYYVHPQDGGVRPGTYRLTFTW